MSVLMHIISLCWHQMKERIRTSPRRAGKDDTVTRRVFQAPGQEVENVALDPENLIGDTVQLSVMFAARQNHRIFFDGEDLLPASRKRERYCVTSHAGKSVDYACFVRWCTSDLFSDFPWASVSERSVERE